MAPFQRFLAFGIVLPLFAGATVFVALPYVWTPGPKRDLTKVIGDPERGQYVARIGGCFSCHTDVKNEGVPLAGGRVITTPFGNFLTPNITSDRETGIGAWSLANFTRAMIQGLRPDGSHYYPAFPYTSYNKMNNQDIADLKAYLDTVPPTHNKTPSNNLQFPFNIRRGLSVWKSLYFDPKPWVNNQEKSANWNRGAYIVNGPGHCIECHTPRTLMGGLDTKQHLQGLAKGLTGGKVPDISADPKSGVGTWSEGDLIFLLKFGLTPDGDAVSGSMAEVVKDSTSHYSKKDLKAVITYLKDPSTTK